jgi:hypothetical protein
VLVIAGLIPLWAALFIVFTNMKTLNPDQESIQPVSAPLSIPQTTETELDLEENSEDFKEESLFTGLLGRFRKNDTPAEESDIEADFIEEQPETSSFSSGIPKEMKQVWGATLILVFLAGLAYGFDVSLDYIFREYRWTIGMTNPWTVQLRQASVTTSIFAGIAMMLATLKTGIYLIRN